MRSSTCSVQFSPLSSAALTVVSFRVAEATLGFDLVIDWRRDDESTGSFVSGDRLLTDRASIASPMMLTW